MSHVPVNIPPVLLLMLVNVVKRDILRVFDFVLSFMLRHRSNEVT